MMHADDGPIIDEARSGVSNAEKADMSHDHTEPGSLPINYRRSQKGLIVSLSDIL